MRLTQFLQEARRNPEKNPKMDIVQALEPYKDKKGYFIHFTEFPKLGINPKTRFNTPQGIYAYPLREMWGDFESESIPFVGDAKYVFLLKFTGKFLDVEKYSNNDLVDDVETLGKIYRKEISDELEEVNDRKISDVDIFYFMKHRLANAKDYAYETSAPSILFKFTLDFSRYLLDIKGNSNKNINLWNKIFKQLGYDGVIDYRGRGIIHENEPHQAVFFDLSKIQIVNMYDNKRRTNINEIIVIKDIEGLSNFVKGRYVYKLLFLDLLNGKTIRLESLKRYHVRLEKNFYQNIKLDNINTINDLVDIFDEYINSANVLEEICIKLKKVLKNNDEALNKIFPSIIDFYWNKSDKSIIKKFKFLYKNKNKYYEFLKKYDLSDDEEVVSI